ncbi:MAG TPA: SpoIIE family protein phosphatase [Acidimicrobiia bacterium]|nr:SpoIIE family protein phosphatase [Acidimicrobiia bacterium]
MSPASSELLRLPPEAGSVREARRFVRRQLATWGCEELVDPAVLCVSELVTNAVIHAHTALSLTLSWSPPRLRVELRDHSRTAAIGARTLAAVGGHVGSGDGNDDGNGDGNGAAVSQATSGRGLLIVANLAVILGETIEDDGKLVWFELEAGRTRGAAPAVIVQQPAAADGQAATPTVRLLDVPVGLAVTSDDHLNDLARELSLDPAASLSKRLLGALAEVGGSFPFDAEWRERLRSARVFGNPRLEVPQQVDIDRLAALRRVVAALDEAEDAMQAGELLALPPPAPVRRFRRWALEEIAAQLAGAAPEPPPENLLAPAKQVPASRFGDGVAADSPAFVDLSDPVQMIARLRRERAEVATLQRVGKAVTSRLMLPDVIQVATDAATEVTPAAFGAFFYNVVDGAGESYTLYSISGVDREHFSQFPMPRNTAVFEPTFRGERTVLLADVTVDARYGRMSPHHGLPAGHLPVRSYLAVPVVLSSGEPIGGLFLGHPEPGRFTPEDARLVEGIAGYAAIAIENARLYEAAQRELEARRELLEERAHVTATLQASLVPPELPGVPGMAVAAGYRPGAADVGGDFYDVFPLRGRHWGFILGDVCGKGPGAAAKTALARYTLRTAAMLERDPANVLSVLNDALLQRREPESFCSAVFARLRADQSGASGELVVAGHPRPLVRRAGGAVERLEACGSLLGIMEGDVAGRQSLSLAAGDVLLLYTDGVTEARRKGELFGEDRLVEAVAGSGPSPEAVVRAVEAAVSAFGDHDRADDVAVLAVSPTG